MQHGTAGAVCKADGEPRLENRKGQEPTTAPNACSRTTHFPTSIGAICARPTSKSRTWIRPVRARICANVKEREIGDVGHYLAALTGAGVFGGRTAAETRTSAFFGPGDWTAHQEHVAVEVGSDDFEVLMRLAIDAEVTRAPRAAVRVAGVGVAVGARPAVNHLAVGAAASMEVVPLHKAVGLGPNVRRIRHPASRSSRIWIHVPAISTFPTPGNDEIRK